MSTDNYSGLRPENPAVNYSFQRSLGRLSIFMGSLLHVFGDIFRFRGYDPAQYRGDVSKSKFDKIEG